MMKLGHDDGNCHQLRRSLTLPDDGDGWRDGERDEGAERDSLISLFVL